MEIRLIQSQAPRPLAHYSEAFGVGDLIFAAGQIASDYRTGVPPEAHLDPAFPYYGSEIKRQAHYILKNLTKTFEAAGGSLDHVFKAQIFLTDLRDFNSFDEVWREYFRRPPARTTVGTTGLLVKDTRVEIDLLGVRKDSPWQPKVIRSDAPPPLANYTEAFQVGPFVFAAGQLASDLKTGVPPEARLDPAFPYYGSEIKKQTRYILGNLKKTFEAAGGSLDRVVKAQVFLVDLRHFNAFDEVWKETFKTPPARTTIGTTGLLVKDTLVEIDLVGVTKDSPWEPKAIRSDAPQPLANYTEAFQVGPFVFAAGQLASDFKTGVPPEARLDPAFPYYGSEIKRQTHYILKNLQKTFQAAGTDLDHVVKAQVFLTDLRLFNEFDEVWREYFRRPPPRTTVGTTGLLVRDTLVEIDLIAVARD